MKIAYEQIRFSRASLSIIRQANDIIDEYQAAGFILTLRQLYYQFVARDLIPNTIQSYKRLGSIINDARMAGEISWEAIEDRTRNLKALAHWESPHSILDACISQYRLDKWKNQDFRPECFAQDTPVITSDGIVPIDCLQVGDKVLTHKGIYKKVTKVIKTPYKGSLLEIKAVGIKTVRVTCNHLLFAAKKDQSTKYKGKERRYSDLDWIVSDKLEKFDVVTIPYLKKRSACSGLSMDAVGGPRSKYYSFRVDDLLLKVAGLYLAEGSVRGDGRTVQFVFSHTEDQYVKLVCEWAERVGVNTSVVSGKGTLVVYLYSKALCNWFHEEFGNGAYHKHIPQWLMWATQDEQLLLLKYYFNGDGTYWDSSRSAPCATTRSLQLALQVQLLFLWVKLSCSFDSVQDHGALRYRVSIGGESADRLSELWDVSIPEKGKGRSKRYNHINCSDDYIRTPIKEIGLGYYDGYVYNLEVEDHHSYCTPISSHNCWIEKDALTGIIAGVCEQYDVPYFACRGYNSQSEQWAAGMRLKRYKEKGQTPVIFHLGDHDPSGIDMTEDNRKRLSLFAGFDVIVHRLALNYDQVQEYNPPPNPAKATDSRFLGYQSEYGNECWELDALDPQVIVDLVRGAIAEIMEHNAWEVMLKSEGKDKDKLRTAREAM